VNVAPGSIEAEGERLGLRLGDDDGEVDGEDEGLLLGDRLGEVESEVEGLEDWSSIVIVGVTEYVPRGAPSARSWKEITSPWETPVETTWRT